MVISGFIRVRVQGLGIIPKSKALQPRLCMAEAAHRSFEKIMRASTFQEMPTQHRLAAKS